MKINYKLKN